jgi:PST family polysaccharide transporter
LLSDITSVYGVQFANYVLPLVTVTYLSRVLGPGGWGLLAVAQAFAMYAGLVVEYGFIFYATRQIATAGGADAIAQIVAGVTGAKLLLSIAVALAVCVSYYFVPVFHHHPLLLGMAVCAEIARAGLPSYFFYGTKRVAIASLLDISARLVAAAGIFFFVRVPHDVWRVFALQAVGALTAFFIGHVMIYSRYPFRLPRFIEVWRMLRESGNMFLFRSAHNIYVLGNAFILGLFASPQVVGYYAGAEKINSAAVGLLSPLSTALYPRAAGLAKTSLPRAARLTTLSLYVMGAVSLALSVIMWFGSSLIVRIILGRQFAASAGVLQILSLRAPLVAWTNVLGFQWLLALRLEKSFQTITVIALLLNLLLAICLAPRYSSIGMAWAVLISQATAALGIYIVLRRRRLSPFSLGSGTTYA